MMQDYKHVQPGHTARIRGKRRARIVAVGAACLIALIVALVRFAPYIDGAPL